MVSFRDVLSDLIEGRLKTVSREEEQELWEEEHALWEECFQHTGPKDQYECAIDLVEDGELERKKKEPF